MKLVTKFDYLDYVRLEDVGMKGRIVKIEFSGGIVYKVEYWLHEEIKTVYVYEDEIETWNTEFRRIGLSK